MKRYVGKIYLNGSCDVTDPCYNMDAIPRTNVSVVPGMYDCYAVISDRRRKVVYSYIVLDSVSKEVIDESIWPVFGYLGADAGFMSFSSNKPDYKDDVWIQICEKLSGKHFEILKSFGNEIFITASGYGDGEYYLSGIKNDEGRYIALRVDFLYDDDECDPDMVYDETDNVEQMISELLKRNYCSDMDSVSLFSIVEEIEEIRGTIDNNSMWIEGSGSSESDIYLRQNERDYKEYLEFLEEEKNHRLSDPVLKAIVDFAEENYGENIRNASYNLEGLADAVNRAIKKER